MDPRIADLERAAAAHWQAAEQAWLGSWLLRADQGFTGRANSALPLGDPGIPLAEAVNAVQAWYAERSLPAMVVVPGPVAGFGTGAAGELDGMLAERGWTLRSGSARVMTATVADVTGATDAGHGADAVVEFADKPDGAWLGRYHYRGAELPPAALRLLLSAQAQAFARVVMDGETVAVGRLSIAEGWAGITAVDVAPERRRAGLGTAITRGLAAEAARQGVDRMFLQTEEDNTAARALYARCGFADAHRYQYRVAPPG